MTLPESSTSVHMAHCHGLWRRTLLVDADGTPDRTTDVRWLQGLTRFVDLRIPTPRIDFSVARCAADLTPEQRDWLGTQNGFAGELTQQADIFPCRIEQDRPSVLGGICQESSSAPTTSTTAAP
ncbi:hypothetical protein ABIA39_002270 [Nocardia sp. GAS34]|uniref:hypothetical protein n=1 Tax=unclassified Nocardia TaxID=2637762 RepID=UPI003D1954C1